MDTSIGGRWLALTERLDAVGDWLAPLGLRAILAWEFWEAGAMKYRGGNWFAQIRGDFPFPFDRVPVDLSWTLATWSELLGALALLLGFGTRFFAFALLVLTAVATAAVHWPADWMSLGELAKGWAIRDEGFGNFKLPLIYAAMLLPLVLRGAGALSLDAVIAARAGTARREPVHDAAAWGVGALVLGLPLAMLLPGTGLALVAAGTLLLAVDRFLTT